MLVGQLDSCETTGNIVSLQLPMILLWICGEGQLSSISTNETIVTE